MQQDMILKSGGDKDYDHFYSEKCDVDIHWQSKAFSERAVPQRALIQRPWNIVYTTNETALGQLKTCRTVHRN